MRYRVSLTAVLVLSLLALSGPMQLLHGWLEHSHVAGLAEHGPAMAGHIHSDASASHTTAAHHHHHPSAETSTSAPRHDEPIERDCDMCDLLARHLLVRPMDLTRSGQLGLTLQTRLSIADQNPPASLFTSHLGGRDPPVAC